MAKNISYTIKQYMKLKISQQQDNFTLSMDNYNLTT